MWTLRLRPLLKQFNNIRGIQSPIVKDQPFHSFSIQHPLSFSKRKNSTVASLTTPVSKRINKMGWEDLDKATLKRYSIPPTTTVCQVEAQEAFNALSNQELLYAHYLSQAAWVGSLIVTVQTSPESPALFYILHDLFKTTKHGIDGVEDIAKRTCGFTEKEWQAFLAYSCGIFTEYGNYKGYGDTKFIPGFPPKKFDQLLKNCRFSSPKALKLWAEIKERVYSLNEQERQLGLANQGITTYFSSNISKEDAELVDRFLKDQKIEPWITRTFKTVKNGIPCFEIRSASAKSRDGNEEVKEFEGANFVQTRGDYSPLLKLACDFLEKALVHAFNDNEKEMISQYIKSFNEGCVDAHKDGSRAWVKNQSPTIETYIGFIETYRDPRGARGEFEGFVAIVNRALSEKFGALVENADKILPKLPWPTEFERNTFLKPDFTYLDVLAFGGSGIPLGINIPNYDEIRQSEGFKNVTLGNRLIAAFKDVEVPFFSKENQQLMKNYFVKACEFQTGLHELLGHGSGLNFVKNQDGTTNIPPGLRNPLTNELVEGAYSHCETYNSVFSELGSPYEECRAETIGIFLCNFAEVQNIFGLDGEEARNVRNVNWLTAVYDGIRSLDMYQADSKKWMQAHSQAAFVTLQVLIEAGQSFVTIKETIGSDGQPDLLASLDLNSLDTVGQRSLSEFILKLQVYKSTADIGSARKMFENYSIVSNEGIYPWLKWRDIVIARKLPRKMCLQANTVLSEDENTVTLKSYEKSLNGIIQATIDRLPNVDIYSPLQFCYEKDKDHFPS